MQSNLKLLSQIQSILQKAGYPDYKRVSLEVVEYISKSNISIEDILRRLESGEPWEYIRGYAQFCNSNFKVNKDTLIPRIETEQIVLEAIKILNEDKDIKNILDVGTGTGCIPISIEKELPNTYSIIATDISKEAIKVAIENEKQILNVSKILWLDTDLIDGIELNTPTLITANLPYIPSKQYKKLDRSVKDFEPRIALEGGQKGYEIYERLFNQINDKRINVKYLILETESSIFSKTLLIAKKSFKDAKIETQKDIYDRERFLLISFL